MSIYFQSKDARLTIEDIRKVFTLDRFQFEFSCSVYLAGDSNKLLRQQIVEILTREKKPLSKCGLFAVTELLQAHFTQKTLF